MSSLFHMSKSFSNFGYSMLNEHNILPVLLQGLICFSWASNVIAGPGVSSNRRIEAIKCSIISKS